MHDGIKPQGLRSDLVPVLSYRSSFLHERNWQDRGFVYNSSGCLELNEIPTCLQKLKRIKCLPYPWLVIHSVGL